jgi:hypothetical protein
MGGVMTTQALPSSGKTSEAVTREGCQPAKPPRRDIHFTSKMDGLRYVVEIDGRPYPLQRSAFILFVRIAARTILGEGLHSDEICPRDPRQSPQLMYRLRDQVSCLPLFFFTNWNVKGYVIDDMYFPCCRISFDDSLTQFDDWDLRIDVLSLAKKYIRKGKIGA